MNSSIINSKNSVEHFSDFEYLVPKHGAPVTFPVSRVKQRNEINVSA